MTYSISFFYLKKEEKKGDLLIEIKGQFKVDTSYVIEMKLIAVPYQYFQFNLMKSRYCHYFLQNP